MSAKSELLDRLKYLDTAVENEALIEIGVDPTTDHNGASNLLRKGLGIVAFNILEDFIKNKTSEALENISDSGISFQNLTQKLQEAATLGAVSALQFRAKIEKKDGNDWMNLIHEESIKIHSTTSDNFQISSLSLVSANSNISENEVTELMKAFGISGGWVTLKNISDNISGGVADLCQAYKYAAERRHSSAHVANFKYEYTWLSAIKIELIAIAASLDISLTAMCRAIFKDSSKDVSEHNIGCTLNFRFLEQEGLIYRETRVVGGRSSKNWDSLDSALSRLRPQLPINDEFLTVLNRRKRIIDWYN